MPGAIKLNLPPGISSAVRPLNLGNYTAQLKGPDSDPNQIRTGKAIDEIQDMVNRLLQANQATSSITVPSVINEQEVVLKADTLIIPKVTPVIDQALIVYVTQDTTGGHKITWNPQFVNAALAASQAPGAMTCFGFIGRVDPSDGKAQAKWFFLAMWPEILDQENLLTATVQVAAAFQPSPNKALLVDLTQDTTGGWGVTWDPNSFDPTTPTQILTDPKTQSRIFFEGRYDSAVVPTALAVGYTLGSGLLNVPSTTPANAIPLPFLLTLVNPSTGAIIVTLQVTAINSPTQYAVAAVGPDANGPIGSLVTFQARWYPLASVPPSSSSTGGVVVAQTINFGLPNDNTGTNVSAKYGLVLQKSSPIAGFYTVNTPAPHAASDSHLDILYSLDNGASWTSIFDQSSTGPGGYVIIPKFTASPSDFVANPRWRKFAGTGSTDWLGGPITWTGNPVFPIGTLLRVDGLQSGGATDILLILQLAPHK